MAMARDDILLDEGFRAVSTATGVATASDSLSFSCDWHGCKNTKKFETLSKLKSVAIRTIEFILLILKK